MPDYLTVAQLASAINVNPKTAYRHLKQSGGRINGIIVAIQIASVWRVLPEAVERIQRGEFEKQDAA